MLAGRSRKERGHTITKRRQEKNNKYLKKCEDQGECFSPLQLESFRSAAKEMLDLFSDIVKKASELLHIDFALLLSCWKKRISTTLQVYTAIFILELSASKRNPQRRIDSSRNESCSCSSNFYVMFTFYVILIIIKSSLS